MLSRISFVTLAAAFALIAGQVGTADAQSVPIKGSGTEGMYDPGSGTYWGEGIVSHMGRSSYVGNIVITDVFPPTPGTFFAGLFEGTQELVAANGDKLFFDVSGEVNLEIDPATGLVFGTWLLDWEITGGTGRFEGATGSTEGAAINPPFDPAVVPWIFDWYFDGEIDLAKRR